METEVADLKAQIIALRVAVEGAWLSLLAPSPTSVADARRLGEQHAAAVGDLKAGDDASRAIRDAVVFHTGQIWGSIAWQLENPIGERPADG